MGVSKETDPLRANAGAAFIEQCGCSCGGTRFRLFMPPGVVPQFVSPAVPSLGRVKQSRAGMRPHASLGGHAEDCGACARDCDRQSLPGESTPAARAALGQRRPRMAVSGRYRERRRVIRGHCLRFAELPGDEILEKPRDPCAARPAQIPCASAVVDVRHADRECRRRRSRRSLAGQPFYVEREVVRSKSEAHDLGRKCKLVTARKKILMRVAGKQRLPGLVETEVYR